MTHCDGPVCCFVALTPAGPYWRSRPCYVHVVVVVFTTEPVLLKLVGQVHKDDVTELRQPAVPVP